MMHPLATPEEYKAAHDLCLEVNNQFYGLAQRTQCPVLKESLIQEGRYQIARALRILPLYHAAVELRRKEQQ